MIGLIKTAVYAIATGLIFSGIIWVLGMFFGFDVDFWYSARWIAAASFIFDVVMTLVIAIITDDHDDHGRFGRTRWF